MKEILIKTICILLLILTLYTPSAVYASSLDEVITSGNKFLEAAKGNKINEGSLKEKSDYIYNTLFIIAIVAAVITGTIMGMQFIMGSVEEQAKIKEAIVPFVVGVIVVVASFTIWKVVVNIGNDITDYEATENTGNDSGTGDDSDTGGAVSNLLNLNQSPSNDFMQTYK